MGFNLLSCHYGKRDACEDRFPICKPCWGAGLGYWSKGFEASDRNLTSFTSVHKVSYVW